MSVPTLSTDNGFAALGKTFCVQLQMKSDWHIGSGTGRPGEVDRLVLRDKHDLPYVPAKSLTGIWRDACERVALGLDEDEPGAWCKWVPFLFGEQAGHRDQELESKSPDDYEHPIPAALSVRSAHLPQDLISALKDKDAVREAVTFVKPGVSIDPRSGRAKTDHLRFEEMARVGAILTAECELDWSKYKDEERQSEQKQAATALLVAGARLVERLGGKRRRGAGCCELTVDNRTEFDPVWQWITEQEQPPAPPALKEPDQIVLAEYGVGDGWQRVQLTLTMESPVVVSTRTVGNLVETADYIPGTYLLAIIRRRLQPLGVNLNSAIVNGDLIVTNATCEVGNERGRPTPLSIFHEKLDGGLKEGKGVFNRFHDPLDLEKDPQVKGARGGYLGTTTKDTIPAYKSVRLGIQMHNVVNDEFQRPQEDVGGVYSYQAIKAGQTLRAELRIKQSLAQSLIDKKTDWFADLNGTHRLGRSKKDDYGVIRLAATAIKAELPKPETGEKKLTVWLLSNLLLRDERLRPTASVESLQKELEKKLKAQKVKLQVRDVRQQKLLSNLTRQQRTDSWQVSWGLPRPSLVGLAAGSCVVFDVKGEIDDDDLKRLADAGLGERRAEGYGQLCFNDPLLETELRKAAPRCDDAPPSAAETSFLIPKQSAFDYGRIIEREAVRREIQRQAIAVANKSDQRKEALGIKVEAYKSHPPMSQLGALRSVIGRLHSAADKSSVINWLEHLEDTPNRFDKWPKEAKGNVQSGKQQKVGLKLLRDLIGQQARVWELVSFDWSTLVITETGENELKTELWAEAVRALVDTCVRAQKRATEKRNTEGGPRNGTQN